MAALKEGSFHDVTAESVTLRVDGDDVPALHVRPDGMQLAGLVLHPDIMGPRPLCDGMARRLATNGLAVVMPDPFSRLTDDQRAAIEARMGAVSTLDDAAQLADLETAADLLVVADDVSQV